MLFIAFSILTFALSYYLNQVTTKSIRATVLSFKGMALNVGYGLIGVLYALLGAHLRGDPDLAADPDALFMRSIAWFPWYFAAGTVLVVLLSLVRCSNINRVYTHTRWRNRVGVSCALRLNSAARTGNTWFETPPPTAKSPGIRVRVLL